jgi:hypothetical protein
LGNASKQTYQQIDCGGGTYAMITAHDPDLFDKIAENARLAALAGNALSGENLVQAILEDYPTQISRVSYTNPKEKRDSGHAINNETDGICIIAFDQNGIVTEVQREYSGGHIIGDSNIQKIYSASFYNKQKNRVFKALSSGDPEKIASELSKYTPVRILYFMQDALNEKNNPAFFLLQKEMERRDGYTPVDAEKIERAAEPRVAERSDAGLAC